MDAATTADQSPPRRRPRLLADTESSPTTAAVETTGEEDAPDRCGENAKGGNAVEASAKQSKATTMLNIALETDIGHDCDDIQALIVALKDHLIGRVRIVYIATVSQANVRRANLVQWLCGRMGVHDVPIVPSLREKAKVEGRPLNNCVDLWQYVLNEVRVVVGQTATDVALSLPYCLVTRTRWLYQVHLPLFELHGIGESH